MSKKLVLAFVFAAVVSGIGTTANRARALVRRFGSHLCVQGTSGFEADNWGFYYKGSRTRAPLYCSFVDDSTFNHDQVETLNVHFRDMRGTTDGFGAAACVTRSSRWSTACGPVRTGGRPVGEVGWITLTGRDLETWRANPNGFPYVFVGFPPGEGSTASSTVLGFYAED
ncbi:hypothetical protein [Sandaracinus amylolyticus]|uniref:hypothetical protein n=1 Tax=Sandaracinus amylolyticus TaxID=927083 RepID=UPI001F2C72A4|nr:hypothetical protein [Sandaracinus amylolyticus]UJR82225.1 Hypothetical protein I5071_42900 [Sandaracinus amylolyticus]